MSLRDNKKAQTREALRASAFRLFRAKGFDRTTIDDIALEAGVSRTTFFRYFATKESVIFDRWREIGEVFRRWIAERPRHENPFEAFEGALLALAREVPRDSELAKESLEVQELFDRNPSLRKRRAEHRDEQIALVAQALADRDGRPIETEHRLAASLGVVVSDAVRDEWRDSGGEKDLEALMKEQFATLRALIGGSG